jgi:multidrug efflux pump subunit AcrB
MAEIVPMLRQANRQVIAGGLTSNNRETIVETGGFLANAQEAANGGWRFRWQTRLPREVAEIKDGAQEPSNTCSLARARATRLRRENNPRSP